MPFIARITSPATTPPRLLRVPSKPAALAGPFGSTVCMDTTSINLQKKQKKKKKKKRLVALAVPRRKLPARNVFSRKRLLVAGKKKKTSVCAKKRLLVRLRKKPLAALAVPGKQRKSA